MTILMQVTQDNTTLFGVQTNHMMMTSFSPIPGAHTGVIIGTTFTRSTIGLRSFMLTKL